jgi:hypothetical protein
MTAGSGGVAGGAEFDAGDGFGYWSYTDPSGCISAGVPTTDARPMPNGMPDMDPIYFGITKLFLGSQNTAGMLDPNAWQTIGFDLDGVCTNSDTCMAEMGNVSCKSATKIIPFDGDDCRDNTFGRFEYDVATIPSVGAVYKLNDDAFNCGLCHGTFNFLIKVSSYNGGAEDDQVRVDTYPSPGLEAPLGQDCTNTELCWLSNMPWTIETDSMPNPAPGPDLPPANLFDDNAFVHDGYLIIHLPPDAKFWFPTGPGASINTFPLVLQSGIVVAAIGQGQDGTWQLTDGTIAGRTKSQDIISGFALVGLCQNTDPSNYSLMTSYVAANLDILADGTTDATMKCDALSVGIGFLAQEATAGKLQDVTPLNPCAAGAAGTAGAAGSAGSGGLSAARAGRSRRPGSSPTQDPAPTSRRRAPRRRAASVHDRTKVDGGARPRGGA